jgi:membrane peptidoglycan carboxypeptidase
LHANAGSKAPAGETRVRSRKPGYRRVVDYPRWGRRGWRAFVPSWRLAAGLSAVSLLAVIAAVVVVYELVKTPDVNDLSLPTATVYEYSNGTPFYTAGLQDRVVIPASAITPIMAHAVVAIENPTFYTDEGISPRGILRALVNDVRGNPLQGGSTITQQFVKNAYLTDAQTVTRKLSEIFIAVKITRSYSKTQILDDYFNTVYFGRGSYGLQAAAETYFGISARQITSPGQAAYLAALVNAPTILSQPDAADQLLLRQRWNLVLNDMVKYHYLTAAERAAVRWPAVLPLSDGVVEDANGVNESAMAEVADDYLDGLHAQNPQIPDSATADAGGDVIVTTFTRAAMTDAVRAVRDQLYDRLGDGRSPVDRGVQVGLATVDASNGELLGFYPGDSDYDNATQAQIEPGSTMGEFAKVAIFSQPPRSGVSPLWTLMSRVGLTRNLIADPAELPEPLSSLKDDPDLALGIAPESPARIAAAYSIFANGGIYHDLAMISSVSVDGRSVWNYTPTSSSVLPEFFAKSFGESFATPGTPGTPGSAEPETFLSSSGTPGVIGGDDSAWFTGFSGDIVTSVGLWDQATNAKHQLVRLSLAGLGEVGADDSFMWPTTIWKADMATLSPVVRLSPIPQPTAAG